MKELYRNLDQVLKPHRPLISQSLPIATRLPILVFASIVKQPVEQSINDTSDEFFDAPDHFSDDEFDDEFDDDFDEEQAPEDDISEMVIHFQQLEVWNNSEHNEVEYILPPNYGKV